MRPAGSASLGRGRSLLLRFHADGRMSDVFGGGRFASFLVTWVYNVLAFCSCYCLGNDFHSDNGCKSMFPGQSGYIDPPHWALM